MLEQLYADTCSFLQWAWGVLNSSFWTALVGAFAGAVGAQRFSESSAARDDTFEEIRRINAAAQLAFSISSMAISLKTQHVLPMAERFNFVVAEIERFNEKSTLDPNFRGVFNMEADFKTFPGLNAPIQPLKDLIYDKISLIGRPLSAVAYLESAVVGLNGTIEQRSDLVREFSRFDKQSKEFAFRYCGLTMPDGSVDQRYHDVVSAIDSYSSDVIFFAVTLTEGLLAYGERIRNALPRRHRSKAPKVSKIDFSGPRKDRLIPDNQEYEQWLRGIAEHDSSKETSTFIRRAFDRLRAIR